MSDRASSFRLQSDDGTQTSLADYAGKYVVLYFYPKDDTPGCTREAQAFSALVPQFAKRDVDVLAVSRDSIERHQKFRAKYDLTVKLLSDPDAAVHKKYEAFGEKKLYGKVSEGALRTTLLIGPDGKIVRRWSSVKVDGHADAVLAELDAALSGTPAAAPHPSKKPAAKAPLTPKPAAKAAKPAKKAAKSKL